MAKTTRITIPTVPGDLIQLAQDIEAKHTALGKDSPLALLKRSEASPKIAEADDVNTKIEKMSKELEVLTERRRALTDYLGEFVRQGRDVLSGVYRSEMKKLSEFGFDVGDSPKAKKSPAPEKKI